MMYKTKKEQQKALVIRIAGLTILIILLMVSILYGIGVSSEINRESPVGAVSQVGTVSQLGTESYVTQLESLAVGKGYTTEDKFTYKERQQLETEEGRYIEVMTYLEDTEVSESEFKEIKDIQSKYEQSLQQVNESKGMDTSEKITTVFIIITIIVLSLLITDALEYYIWGADNSSLVDTSRTESFK